MSAPRRIVTIQAGLREIGRIRMGVQETAANGKIRPARLDTFRLTSRDETAIRAAADVYGGQVSVWADAPEQTGRQWQVIITSPFLDVMVPPNGYESSFELWTSGGCQRRCNGQFEEITRGKCLCPSDPQERTALAKEGQACKPTSRLRVMLTKLKSIGAWRLESHGYFAAVELGGMADLLEAATMQGYAIPARLRIEKRRVKRPGEEPHDFIVPVLEIPDFTPQQMLGAGPEPERLALPPGPDLPRARTVDVTTYDDAEPVEAEIIEERPSGLTVQELQRRAGGNIPPNLTKIAREKFGKSVGALTDAERLEVAIEGGFA